MTIRDLRQSSNETLVEKSALVAGIIPVIGPLASGAAKQAVSSRRWERLIMFISNVLTRLEDLERSVPLSAEQEDMTADIFEKVFRERSHERLQCYQNIFLGVLASQDWEYDEVEEYVKKIDRLTSNDIKLLAVIADPHARDQELNGAISKTAHKIHMGSLSSLVEAALPDWGEEALPSSWESLRSERILSQEYPSGMGSGSSVTLDALKNQLSAYGAKFVEFVVIEESE